MTKKVLQIVGSFHQGGSERQAVQLARALRRDRRVEVYLATMTKEGPLLKEAEAEFGEIPEFRIGSFLSPKFLSEVKRAAKFISDKGIEVIHSHDFYTNVFASAVATVADIPLFVASKRETGGMRTKAQRWIEKIAFRKADAILVNSRAVRDHLKISGVRESKLSIVYNGLDAERLTPKITDRRKICGLLELPQADDLRFITLVANLRHGVKNGPMFIRAAAKLVRTQEDVHFVLAGEGDLRESLERLAAESGLAGRVHFTGRCEMVPELLSVSYACVLTSFHEGFPNAVLEYMAAGKPAVATDVGGVSEVVEDGVTGYLIRSDDSDALADRLSKLMSNPELAALCGERGRKKVLEEFSIEKQVESTLAVYGL